MLGFACAGGDPGGSTNETAMYLDDIVITCDGADGFAASLEVPAGGPASDGNQLRLVPDPDYDYETAPPGVFQWAVYSGEEHLVGPTGSLNKRYYNVAIGVQNLEDCTVTTRGTADSGDVLADRVIESSSVYPYVVWDVRIGAGGECVPKEGDPDPFDGNFPLTFGEGASVGTAYTATTGAEQRFDVELFGTERIRGACGSASGEGHTSTPGGDGLCASGEATEVVGSGPWTWTCAGQNGGATAGCGAPLRVHGACGSADDLGHTSSPLDGLCEAGEATDVTGTGPWDWSCVGAHGGTTASCSAPLQVSGSCGSADGGSTASGPAPTDLCASGTATPVTGDGPYAWSCQGQHGGSTADCSSNRSCDSDTVSWGACGAPRSGQPHGFSGSVSNTSSGYTGSATTTCHQGTWNLSSTICNQIVNGACASHTGSYSTQPATNTSTGCTAGSYSNMSDTSTHWRWQCVGSNGGTTATCSAQKSTSSGGGGGGCFTGTTMILMADGTQRPIADLQVGDLVQGKTQVNIVTANMAYTVTSPVYRINDSDEAYVTATHPFYTADGWKAFDPEGAMNDHWGVVVTQLELGDVLLDMEGNEVVLESFEAEDHGEIVVYNPSLDGDHTYYANGYLMHNQHKF